MNRGLMDSRQDQARTAQAEHIDDADLAVIVVLHALRPRDFDRLCLETVAAFVEEDVQVRGAQVQQVCCAAAVEVDEQYMRRVERLIPQRQCGQYKPLAKTAAPQVRPAFDFVVADSHQMLLTRGEYIAERHHFVGRSGNDRQAIVRPVRHFGGRGEAGGSAIFIQAHAARADHRKVMTACPHQVGEQALGVEELRGEGIERRIG
ncbi:hypothetical protein [Pseudomonas sp. 24 E 13]|nr:hypothetical protein [Pseudomonas sp. 24 E 13]